MKSRSLICEGFFKRLQSFNWKKTIFLLLFLIIIFLTIYLNQAVYIIKKICDYFIDLDNGANVSISDRIYFSTLLAIIWYAYETRLLREVTFGRPLISIIKNVNNTIEIRNDGSSIAYNIEINFLYNRITQHKIKIPLLGKGLFRISEITNIEIKVGPDKKVKLSDLINPSPPDKNLYVLIYYSDSVRGKKQFEDKWELDEAVIISSNYEGRFKMTRSRNF